MVVPDGKVRWCAPVCRDDAGYEMMERETCAVESTFFIPNSGLDAANYVLLGMQIKIAAHEDVPLEHLHFADELRDIIAIHKISFRTEVAEDGSVRKSTSREVISRMDELLQRLDAAGLRLCFRMWSISTAQELVRNALAEEAAVETNGYSYDAQRDPDISGYGAIVGFLIVPLTMPLNIPDCGNGHGEICVSQVPDWDVVPDELAQG